MGPGIFLIAIMGCGEGDAPCRQVRTLDTQYQTQAACTAATAEALGRNGDADYPVVVAQCIAAGARAQVRASDVKLPTGGRANLRISPLRS
jgi:hypothetical protein